MNNKPNKPNKKPAKRAVGVGGKGGAPEGNKNAVGNEGGSPTLYREEYNHQAYKLCLLGATDKGLADFFEVCEKTINNWKIEHVEFLQSIREGKKVADMSVAHSLYEGTKDRVVTEQMAFKLKEVIYDEDTGRKLKEVERIELVDVQKAVPGDFRNQQFWLKNRQSDTWKDKRETEHSGEMGINWNEEKTYPGK